MASSDFDVDAIEPHLSALTPYCAWGALSQTRNNFDRNKSQIQRISDQEFLFISGSRIAIYDVVAYSTSLMITLPSILQYHSLHLSPNEKYLACPVELRDLNSDHMVASLAVYDFPAHLSRQYYGTGSKFANITPRLLQYKKSNNNNNHNQNQKYKFDLVSFYSDGSFIAMTTSDANDGVLVFNTNAALSASFAVPMRQLPITTAITEINFHPTDSNKYCVSGVSNYFMFWRFSSNALRSAPVTGFHESASSSSTSASITSATMNSNEYECTYTCHTWIDEKLVLAGNSRGSIYVILGCEVLCSAKDIFHSSNDTSSAKNKEYPVSKIFVKDSTIVCCCYPHSLIAVLDLRKSKSTAHLGITARLVPMVRYALKLVPTHPSTPDEQSLSDSTAIIAGMDWCYRTDRGSDTILVASTNSISSFDLNLVSIHSPDATFNQINSILSPTKESQASIWRQRQVVSPLVRRMQNQYTSDESNDRDMLCTYPIEGDNDPASSPLCCHLHPSGLYLAIGGVDDLAEYAIADKSLRLVKSIQLKSPFYSTAPLNPAMPPIPIAPIVCTQSPSILRYSHSGHLLAVTCGKVLRVYNMLRMDYHNADAIGSPSLSMAVTDHSAPLTDMQFTYDDTTIVVTTADGYVYHWNIRTSQRYGDYCMKGYTAVALAVGSPMTSTTGKPISNAVSSIGSIIVSYSSLSPDNKKSNYLALWRQDKTKKGAAKSAIVPEFPNGGVANLPELVALDSCVTSMDIGWSSDGYNRLEVCVLGFEDGHIVVTTLPLPLSMRTIVNTDMQTSTPPIATSSSTTKLFVGNLTSKQLSSADDTLNDSNTNENKDENTEDNANSDPRKEMTTSYAYLNESSFRCRNVNLHCGSVRTVVVSPSGSYVFSAGIDGCVQMLLLGPTSNTTANTFATQKYQRTGNHSNNDNGNGSTSTMNEMSIFPEARQNFDNELLLTKKTTYYGMKSRLLSFDMALANVRSEQQIALHAMSGELKDQQLSYELKLKNEISKRDAIISKYQTDLKSMQKQLKSELENKELMYREKFRVLEIEYDKKMLHEQERSRILKQSYDEHLCVLKMDIADREKQQDSKLIVLEDSKKQCETELTQQKKAVELYVQYLNERNQEVFSDLESNQVGEREYFHKEMRKMKQQIDEQERAAKSDVVFYQTQIQLCKHDIKNKEDKVLQLTSELDWSKNRVESLELDIIGLRKELDTATSFSDRWESKAKEQQQTINDLEKTRKSLSQQMHTLRQEINPHELNMHKVTDKLNLVQSEYAALLQKTSEKDSQLQVQADNIHLLQKQLRELRKQSLQKDGILRRTAKLFEDYKSLLSEGEGHKKFFPAGSTALTFSVMSNTLPTKSNGNSTALLLTQVPSLSKGRLSEEMDRALTRIDELMKQFASKDLDDTENQEEATQLRNERERHLHYLHASISGLATNLKHTKTVTDTKMNRRLHDNQDLLLEVNELRHEVRGMAQDNQRLQATVEYTNRRFNRQLKEEVLKRKKVMTKVKLLTPIQDESKDGKSDEISISAASISASSQADSRSRKSLKSKVREQVHGIEEARGIGQENEHEHDGLTLDYSTSNVLSRNSSIASSGAMSDATRHSVHSVSQGSVSRPASIDKHSTISRLTNSGK